MVRLVALLVFFAWTVPAAAQSEAEFGQMRLYIQHLEQQVRQLTGQNEQLTYELNQLRAQTGQAGVPAPDGVAATQPTAPQQALGQPVAGDPATAAPANSIAADDPLIAHDGEGELEPGGPVDLSVLAEGNPAGANAPGGVQPTAPSADPQVAALPGEPTSLSGSARDQYDLAYGYVLTGDYDLAEKSFQDWLAANPSDPQAADARFWLGESHYQQREYREAANSFLTVYKEAGQSPKAPDALVKLGMSLAALGETPAACATLAEVGKRFPQADKALMSRVDAEADRAGC